MNELCGFIQRASASGLITKWLKSSRPNYGTDIKSQSIIYLKLEYFYGAALVGFTVHAAVFLTFLIEKYIHKKANTLNASRFWKYAEMAIDSHRYLLLEDLK